MHKIMLCCSAGMSTSMLVRKMEQAAADNGIEQKLPRMVLISLTKSRESMT
ncbi:PTS system [Vibrio ishigakensis]|uniref:PTS system n=1 Tax=Vibrio ishigakensis TaxID=1481914 RepID=A0A0B8QEI2_9VIBR|nr:PTS system [Vibrio ishigakensis]